LEAAEAVSEPRLERKTTGEICGNKYHKKAHEGREFFYEALRFDAIFMVPGALLQARVESWLGPERSPFGRHRQFWPLDN
jgi:hypothetical protein